MPRLATAERTALDALADLLAQMDAVYGDETKDPLDVRIRQIEAALFGQPPAAHALPAWDGDRLVGLATHSFLWLAVGLTRSLFLKGDRPLQWRRPSFLRRPRGNPDGGKIFYRVQGASLLDRREQRVHRIWEQVPIGCSWEPGKRIEQNGRGGRLKQNFRCRT